MRLFEVEDRFTNDLITVFRQLRGRSDVPSERTPLTLPWVAVNGMLKNFGYSEIDTAALANLVKQSPALNNEVKTFDDETGITLKTKAEKVIDSSKVGAKELLVKGAEKVEQGAKKIKESAKE